MNKKNNKNKNTNLSIYKINNFIDDLLKLFNQPLQPLDLPALLVYFV